MKSARNPVIWLISMWCWSNYGISVAEKRIEMKITSRKYYFN
jgi:hypothetical protein